MVIPAGQQAHIVDHGEAGGEELDGSSHEIVARVAVECREVGAVVLVGVADVAAALALVEVLHVGVASQSVLHHLLQLLHIAHLAPTTLSHPISHLVNYNSWLHPFGPRRLIRCLTLIVRVSAQHHILQTSFRKIVDILNVILPKEV